MQPKLTKNSLNSHMLQSFTNINATGNAGAGQHTFCVGVGRRNITAGNTYNWLHRPVTSTCAVVMATVCLFISDVSRALVVR